MSKLTEMTPGVVRALQRHPHHSVCDCGFPLPRYPGRYPKHCPKCGEERRVPSPEEVARVSDSEE